jgi:apoptosis-inducing factor 1
MLAVATRGAISVGAIAAALVGTPRPLRSDAPVSAPGSIADPPANRQRPTQTGDVTKALAIMEHYHRMSVEAIAANGISDTTSCQRPSQLESVRAVSTTPSIEILTLDAVPSVLPASASFPRSISGPGSATTVTHVEKKSPRPRVPAKSLFTDVEKEECDLCCDHVLVGGGTAVWSAVQAIRARDPTARILVITDELYYPYNRTPLSKDLWESSSAAIFNSEYGTRSAVEYSYTSVQPIQNQDQDSDHAGSEPSVSIIRGEAVASLDVDSKTVTLVGGRSVQYRKLLLATGGEPRPPGSVCDGLERDDVAPRVSVFRTIADFRALRRGLDGSDASVAVIGGGFLGTELAVAMAGEGRRVTLLCSEPGVLYKVLPRYVSEFLSRRLAKLGVIVMGSAIVTDAYPEPQYEDAASQDSKAGSFADRDIPLEVIPRRVVLSVGGGVNEIRLDPVDKVVVATGISPRVDLAVHAGLEIDDRNGGIVVNDQMMAEADIWAAGDAASYWDRNLGRRRVEHWDHAVVTGRIAGDRMAGGSARYGLQSKFWSDLSNIDVSLEAVGLVDPSLETVAVWNTDTEPVKCAPSANSYTAGIVYYLRGGVVVGAVLWNLSNHTALASVRKAIASKLPIPGDSDAVSLVRLPKSRFMTVIRTGCR